MELVWLVILQCIGAVAIIAEVLVPSFGFLTITAIIMYGLSYYQLYQYNSDFIPLLLLINIISIPATLVLAVRFLSKTTLSLTEQEKFSPQEDFPCSVGEYGEAVTDLRPAGKMKIGSRLIDVLSTGNYISRGVSVKVVSIDNAGIKVVQCEQNQEKMSLSKPELNETVGV